MIVGAHLFSSNPHLRPLSRLNLPPPTIPTQPSTIRPQARSKQRPMRSGVYPTYSYDPTPSRRRTSGRDVYLAYWYQGQLDQGANGADLSPGARAADLRWQRLSAIEKEPFEREALGIQLCISGRFPTPINAESSAGGSDNVPTKTRRAYRRATEPTLRQKRPVSAFMLFLNQARLDSNLWTSIVGTERSARQQSKLVGQFWRQMSDESKLAKAEIAMLRHKDALRQKAIQASSTAGYHPLNGDLSISTRPFQSTNPEGSQPLSLTGPWSDCTAPSTSFVWQHYDKPAESPDHIDSNQIVPTEAA
ncbi:hypothetical protein MKEN_00656100 [Mycena kentingensis (nom. inval.)]|nr:hypothetical protein MKEN_00656100 [Mycena kentingensis (nom. inval.)]